MPVLLSCVGTMGDLMPVLATGRQLTARGHGVEIMANDVFEDLIRASGLDFHSLGDRRSFDSFISGAAWQGRDRGWAAFLREGILPCLEPAARRVQALAGEYGRDITVVPNNYSYGARWAARSLKLPVVNLCIQPGMLRGIKSPDLASKDLLPGENVSYWRGMRAAEDYLFHTFGRTGAGATAGLGRLFEGGRANSADECYLALFPGWFHAKAGDWPDRSILTGFPLIDTGADMPLADELEAFLETGDAPVGLFCGSFMREAGAFFAKGLQACRANGKRTVILCRFPGDLPDDLPGDCLVVPSAPFGRLFPRLQAVIHHGGIGTIAQAMAAGKPQLVMPLRFEQPDNADSMQRLGVGTVVPLENASENLADVLESLLSDRNVSEACAATCRKMSESNPFDGAAAVIEQAAGGSSLPD